MKISVIIRIALEKCGSERTKRMIQNIFHELGSVAFPLFLPGTLHKLSYQSVHWRSGVDQVRARE